MNSGEIVRQLRRLSSMRNDELSRGVKSGKTNGVSGGANRLAPATRSTENGRFISRRVLREARLCAVRVGNREMERFARSFSVYTHGASSGEPELIPHELRRQRKGM